jgi:ABC-type Na+ efflux pump permease subunit
VLRDAIAHNAIDWAAMTVSTLSLLGTALIAWFAVLRLFTREALLTRS